MGADQAREKESQSVVEFSDKKKVNFTPALVWGGFVLSVVFLVYLLIAKSGLASTVADLESEKSDITSQLESPSYAQIEDEVMAASDAVDTLSEVKDNEISKKTLLDELYVHITNDVKINSIAIGSDGSLVVDGATGSYRNVADLMLALKSYERVSNLKLVSVAVSDEEDISEKEKVVFSVSATVNFTKKISSTSSSSDGSLSDADNDY